MLSRSRTFGLVALVISTLVTLTWSPAHATGPFNCQPGFYQVISGQLKILNPLTGVYSDIGSTGATYNAIGYNPNDDFIYGWGTGGSIIGQLIKVDSAGVVTPLGTAGITGSSFVSGDFDADNNIYFRKNASTLVRINVQTSPLTYTELPLTGTFEGVDMGWINGVMYSVDDGKLYRVDLATLLATSVDITDDGSPTGKAFPTSGNYSYGAVFSNRDDELYASNNSLGRIYQITGFTTANPKATWVTDATVTSNNDGAACKLAASPFDLPVANNDTYSVANDLTLTVVTADGILDNDSASSPTVTSNSSPASGTLVLNSNGSFTFTPVSGFVGSVTFTYTAQDQWGRNTGTATVTINVTAAATPTTVSASPPAPVITTTTTTTEVAAIEPPDSVPPTTDGRPTRLELQETGSASSESIGPAFLVALIGTALLVRRRSSTRSAGGAKSEH